MAIIRGPYQLELANKIRHGRAVGNLYVITQRPIGKCGIVATFNSMEEALAFLAEASHERL